MYTSYLINVRKISLKSLVHCCFECDLKPSRSQANSSRGAIGVEILPFKSEFLTGLLVFLDF